MVTKLNPSTAATNTIISDGSRFPYDCYSSAQIGLIIRQNADLKLMPAREVHGSGSVNLAVEAGLFGKRPPARFKSAPPSLPPPLGTEAGQTVPRKRSPR